MNIYVLRHGITQWNLEHRIQGVTDIPLLEEGRQEAYALREKVQALPVKRLYTSPLSRALETAHILNEDRCFDLEVEERLREVSFGQWEGWTWKQLQTRHPELMKQRPENGYIDPPEGESFAQTAQRVCQLIDELQRRGEDCLLVTHKAVIRFLVYCLTKKTPAQTGVLDVPNLAILHFDLPENGPATWRFI
jgi:broad specificity phosphatase PhoE